MSSTTGEKYDRCGYSLYPILGLDSPKEWYDTITGLALEVYRCTPYEVMVRLDSGQLQYIRDDNHHEFLYCLRSLITRELYEQLCEFETNVEKWNFVHQVYCRFIEMGWE
ncbi:hypothetical protein KEM56_003405 [Ascosphaera pollenicola]|nr:hypothetical protein KEM56_003405 [Ascosphaera pollenicola]